MRYKKIFVKKKKIETASLLHIGSNDKRRADKLRDTSRSLLMIKQKLINTQYGVILKIHNKSYCKLY